MLFEVKEGIWFDNLSAIIHKGTPRARSVSDSAAIEGTMNRRGDAWHPSLVYLSTTEQPQRCQYCYADCGAREIQPTAQTFTFEDYMESYHHLHQAFGGVDTVSFFGNPLSKFSDISRFVEELHRRYPREEWPSFTMNTDSVITDHSVLEFLKKHHFNIGAKIEVVEDVNAQARRRIDPFTNEDMHVFVQYTLEKAELDSYEPGLAAKWYAQLENLPIDNYDVIPLGSTLKSSDEETEARYLAFCEESADYFLDKLLHDNDISKLPRMFVGLLLRIMTRTLYQDCSAGYSLTVTPDRNVFPCHAFAADDRFAVKLDEIRSENDLLANEWFRRVREADRLKSDKCEKCIAFRVCGVWCKARNFVGEPGFDDLSEERCMLMNVYTRRIVQFLVEQYPAHQEQIQGKLLKYNWEQLQTKSAYEV